MPHVSVIIPTYNREKYVQEAINSVLSQKYSEYEIIVVDDGSTDGTADVLHACYGSRIIYLWQENQGESVARNRGIELSQGEYIAFLDSDDLWLPEKLSLQVAFLESHPDIAMVFTQAFQIDPLGNRIADRILGASVHAKAFTLERLLFENYVTSPSTVVVNREVLDFSGKFDPAIRYGEDWDLWLRIRLFAEVDILPIPLASLRRHKDTQCYFPSPAQNTRRRESHLRSLGKVFTIWSEASQDLQRQALAWQYARSALLEASVGNKEAALLCLDKAIKHDPALIEGADSFVTAIADQAALLYDLNAAGELQSSLDFVRFILDVITELDLSSPSLEQKIKARCYQSLGFMAYQKGNRSATRLFFLRALALNPYLLRNTGVWSILFHASFGQKASSLRKNFRQFLRKDEPYPRA